MTAPGMARSIGGENIEEHLSGKTLPGSLYCDENVLKEEMERFFFRSWLCVGREEQIASPGDYFTREIGEESLLFIRGQDGEIRGFYNLCRHRGTQILDQEEGRGLKCLVCPYHVWTYSPEGQLLGAPYTENLVDFNKADFGLYPLRVEAWGGFLWADLDDLAPPLWEDLGEFFGRFDRFPLADLRLGAKKVYQIEANWKLLIENYSECYHCAPLHPELNRITPSNAGGGEMFFAKGDGPRRKFNGGYQNFRGDYTSMTWTGYTSRSPLKGMTEEDRRRIYYFVVFPNLFFSLHPDYLMVHRIWPASPSHSVIECEWFFDPEAMAREDFDPDDAVGIWDLINRQDWAVCQRTQRGVRSRAWKGGRFSSEEDMVHDFDKYVAERLGRR